MKTSLAPLPLLLAAAAGCSPNAEFDNLRILHDDTVLSAKVTMAGQSYAWEGDELGVVPATALPLHVGSDPNAEHVTYFSQSTRTELDLFMRAPNELSDTMTYGGTSVWDTVSEAAFVPPALVVTTYNNIFSPYPTYDVPLASDTFVPDILLPPKGAAGLPGVGAAATGSVKGARVYDHGGCSFQQSLVPIFSEINTTFAKKLLCEIQTQHFTGAEDYSNIATLLHHDAPLQNSVYGGFVFDGHYVAETDIAGFTLGQDLFFTSAYQLDVSDGFLVVDETYNHTHVEGQGNTGKTYDMLVAALGDGGGDPNGSLVAAVDVLAEKQQTQDVFGSMTFPCSPDGPHKYGTSDSLPFATTDGCTTAANLLATVAESVATDNGASFDQWNAAHDALTNTHSIGGEPVLDNWRCVPDASVDQGGRCEVFIPAKRINVYPDSVELVWFDGVEYGNPAYSIALAAQSPVAGPGATAQLCQFVQKEVPTYKRIYAINTTPDINDPCGE